MSRSKSELSHAQREILQFIRYRTRDPRHPTYFGSNEDIAKNLGIQKDTAKKYVNELIREGYLAKAYDKDNRRHLAYTNKQYVEIVEDMRSYEKRALKQDKEYFEMKARDLEKELSNAKWERDRYDKLSSELQTKLLEAEMRISYLEQFLYEQSYTKEKIEEIIEQQRKKFNKEPVLETTQQEEVVSPTVCSNSIVEDILQKFNISIH